MTNANLITLANVRKENKEYKTSVNGCISALYNNGGKETKKLLALYGNKEVVFSLSERIKTDMRIGEQAAKKDGTLRTTTKGDAIIVKVSTDLVARWFVANQQNASAIVSEVKSKKSAPKAEETAKVEAPKSESKKSDKKNAKQAA